MRLGGSQSQPGHYGEEKNIFPLLGMKAKMTKTITLQTATNEQPIYHKHLCNQTLRTTNLQTFLCHYFDLKHIIQNHCPWMTATKRAGVVVMLKTCIQEVLGLVLRWDTSYLERGFCGFPQNLQTNAMIIPRSGTTTSYQIPSYSLFTNHPTICSYILWDTDSIMTWTTDKNKWLMQWNEH
jgi:hypothetical protein